MSLLLFIFNNLCLLFLATVLTADDRDRETSGILKAAAVYIIEILALTVIPGLAGVLNLAVLTFLSVLALIAGLFVKRYRKISLSACFKGNRLWTLFCDDNRLLKAIKLILAATLIIKFISAIILIPYCYDSIAYHLTGLVDYIQSRKILTSDKLIWSNSYPRNIEMLNLWTLIYLRNGAALKLVQYFITIIGSVAVYRILTDCSVKKNNAFIGALLYLSTPIMLAQMTSAYIDTSLASILLCALYFMLRYLNSKRTDSLVYMSILLGFLLGIKYSSIGYIGIFVFIFAVAMIIQREKPGRIIGALAITGVICIIVGSVWYVLNMLRFGNPMYPFQIRLLGHIVFPGLDVNGAIMNSNTPELLRGKNPLLQVLISWLGIEIAEFTGNNLYNIVIGTLSTLYDQRIGGFGFQWLLLFVPCFFILMYRRARTRKFVLEEFAIFGVLLLSFFITPTNWWSRYTCFVIFAGIYSFIVLMDGALKYNKHILRLLVFLVALSCWQGSINDIFNDKFVLRNFAQNPQYSIRSGYTQFWDPQLREFSKKLNTGINGFDILTFDISPYMFYFQGDDTQNRLRAYYSENGIITPNYGINSYEKFKNVLEENKADFVIVNAGFRELMSRYAGETKQFGTVGSMDNGNIVFYEKAAADNSVSVR